MYKQHKYRTEALNSYVPGLSQGCLEQRWRNDDKDELLRKIRKNINILDSKALKALIDEALSI